MPEYCFVMSTASTPRNVPASRLDNSLIGTAGWSIPRDLRDHFQGSGSRLERYAQVFNAVEINSSFYRPHRPATYERWAASVPGDFRFSVKMPREITHARRLRDIAAPLAGFLDEVAGLGERLGAILVQLPPSFAFDRRVADDFFRLVRRSFGGTIVIEPRHTTWFDAEATELLRLSDVDLVVADPAPCPAAARWDAAADARYFRMHGAPKIYYSDYSAGALTALARRLTAQARDRPVWCIFDNTASGRATANAMHLRRLLSSEESCS